MKNKIYLFSVIILYSCNLYSQSDSCKFHHKKTIYIEYEGETLTKFSGHLDFVTRKKSKSYTTVNLGFGFIPKAGKYDHPFIGIPLGFSWNRGFKSNHLETGFGFVYFYGLAKSINIIFDRTEYDYVSQSIFGSLRIGYRYQSQNNPIFLKAGISPLIKIKDFQYRTSNYFILTYNVAIGVSIN